MLKSLTSRKSVLSLGALIVAALASSAASAQVIYEPVQYEYHVGSDYKFYYGGDNPLVFEHARRVACLREAGAWVREGRYGVGHLHPGLIGAPPYRVFSDCAPLQNAAAYGFTPADARNEAYARVPQYFTKAAVLAGAAPAAEPGYYRKATPDGIPANGSRVLIAPSKGWPAGGATPGIDIRPYRGGPATGPTPRPETRPAARPRPLMIIPKKLLEQPKASGKSVAAAQ